MCYVFFICIDLIVEFYVEVDDNVGEWVVLL